MKRIQVDDREKRVKSNIREAERHLAEVILNSNDVKVLITALIENIAEIYEVPIAEVERHLDVGVQVAIGFDYSFDFVRDKFKNNPLKNQVVSNAQDHKKNARAVSNEASSSRDLPITETSFFKKLALFGKLVGQSDMSYIWHELNKRK